MFKAFLLVDRPAFHDLLCYMRPNTQESDIPHHKKVREDVLDKADKYLNKLSTVFDVSGYIVAFCIVYDAK